MLPATIADCGKERYDTTLSEMKGERLLSLWYVFIYVYFLGLNKQALLTLLTSGPVSTVASVLVLNLPRGFSVWRCHVLFSCLCGHCSFLPQSTFYDEKTCH